MSIVMDVFLQIQQKASQVISAVNFRRLAVGLSAGLLMLVTTACSQPSVTAGQPSASGAVPQATEADTNRARANLSDEAVNEDVLSQQGPSRARQSSGVEPAK